MYYVSVQTVHVKKDSVNKNKVILKTQKKKSEKHNVFTEEINRIALSSNDDKRMQSIYSIKTYAYRMSKDLVYKKEEVKYNNIVKQYKNV